jgi:solute carrier family 29 (equilibrative nucleoside transporter), member 4
MLSIGLAYFVTLCLYPGIEAEITSCNFGTWMPVLIMAVFNGADLLGKVSTRDFVPILNNLNLENLCRF